METHPWLEEAFRDLQLYYPALRAIERPGPETLRLKGTAAEGLLVKGMHRSAEVTLDAPGRQIVGSWSHLTGWVFE